MTLGDWKQAGGRLRPAFDHTVGFASRFAARQRVAMILLVAATVLAVGIWSAAGLLRGYLGDLARNRHWVGAMHIPLQDRMMNGMFDRAVEAGLIWSEVDRDGARIGIVSCENTNNRLPDTGVGPRGAVARSKPEILSLLCTTEEGGAIREEIRLWNGSEHIIAIRDDRRKPGQTPGQTGARQAALSCDPPPPQRRPRPGQPAPPTSAFGTIPRQCLHNRWVMFALAGDPVDPDVRTVDVQASSLEPPPDEYDFIEEGTPLYMTDWASLTPSSRNAPLLDTRYRLKTDVVLPPSGQLRIDFVGDLRRIRIGGAELDFDKAPTSTADFKKTTDTLDLTVVPLCEGRNRKPPIDCLERPAGVPFSYMIIVQGPAARKVTAVLDARFQRNVPREVRNRFDQQAAAAPQQPAEPPTEEAEEETEDPASTEGQEGDNDDKTWRIETRTPNLIVRCPDDLTPAGPTSCEVSWRALPDPEEDKTPDGSDEGSAVAAEQGRSRPGGAPAPPGYRVVAADSGVNLVEETSGAFTPQSLELGLAPIVGGGSAQWGSLGWALAAGAQRAATLTINAREQAAVRDVLEERRVRCQGKAPTRDCVFRGAGAQAVIALVDASEARAGEIRALVSWPPGRVGAHVWDLAAGGGLGGDWRSPVTARTAWSVGNDALSQPGSTFKVVTALASAQAVLRHQGAWETMDRMLRGEIGPQETVEILPVRMRKAEEKRKSKPCEKSNDRNSDRADTLQVPGRQPGSYYCLQNFEKNKAHKTLFRVPTQTFCADPDGSPGSGAARLGVCEALAQSSNIYFSGLSLLLDQAKMVARDAPDRELPQPSERLDLAGMADRLAPAGEIGRDLMRGSLPRPASLLRLDPRPIAIDAERLDPKDAKRLPDRRVSLALAGYGQNVYASPLVMASIYASLRNGHIVRPRLVPAAAVPPDRRDPETQPLLEGGADAERQHLLALIRAGLANVVAGDHGTARGVFKSKRAPAGLADLRGSALRPRLFGKTGTATITGRINTLWFAGWIEGREDRGIKTPLAFTCQAIRQPSGQKLTGGSVCAPIMKDILLRLDHVAGSEPDTPARAKPRPERPRAAPGNRR